MPAGVIPYSAHPEDTRLTLKWVCPECGVEGGWITDGPGAQAACQASADTHNDYNHTDPGAVVDPPVQGLCDKCGRYKGCNADCEDMNCEHCYCYREGRDG